jgi:hypothetical protein
MILQLPVQNGYLGGRLKIDHGSTAKYFEFEKGSDHCHFLTAFRSSCKHELEPITSGWRATLVISTLSGKMRFMLQKYRRRYQRSSSQTFFNC